MKLQLTERMARLANLIIEGNSAIVACAALGLAPTKSAKTLNCLCVRMSCALDELPASLRALGADNIEAMPNTWRRGSVSRAGKMVAKAQRPKPPREVSCLRATMPEPAWPDFGAHNVRRFR